jgi:hypothetical protein
MHSGARAEEASEKIDTQFIFGFTSGADVGELGENELEHETIVLQGKRAGSYIGLSDQLRAEFVPIQNFRFEFGVPIAYYDIAEVPGLDNLHHGGFDGIVDNARYKLLDRERSSISLTLGLEPHWARIDENSGLPVVNYGGEASIAVDAMLLKVRVFGAINLVYDPEVTRQGETLAWQRVATLGLFTSITTQIQPGAFLGAEHATFANTMRSILRRSLAMLSSSARQCSYGFQRVWQSPGHGTSK